MIICKQEHNIWDISSFFKYNKITDIQFIERVVLIAEKAIANQYHTNNRVNNKQPLILSMALLLVLIQYNNSYDS